MRPVLSVFAAAILSLVLYAALFGHGIKKPLTIGFMSESLIVKQTRAGSINQPKILIVAGSAGLFSIRCAIIERALDRSCLNGAITAELGLGYILEIARRLARPSDTVVMALEYNLYREAEATARQGDAHPFRLTYDPASLADKPLATILRSYMQFDLRYLIGAAIENALALAGIERRYNRDTLTVRGDMRGHTAAKGGAYRKAIENVVFWLPRATEFEITPVSRRTIDEFNRWARERDIHVFATLPTTFDDRPVERGVIDAIATLFRAGGQRFLALPNHGQYPRRCFYDTQYHLNESCQETHSRILANALKSAL